MSAWKTTGAKIRIEFTADALMQCMERRLKNGLTRKKVWKLFIRYAPHCKLIQILYWKLKRQRIINSMQFSANLVYFKACLDRISIFIHFTYCIQWIFLYIHNSNNSISKSILVVQFRPNKTLPATQNEKRKSKISFNLEFAFVDKIKYLLFSIHLILKRVRLFYWYSVNYIGNIDWFTIKWLRGQVTSCYLYFRSIPLWLKTTFISNERRRDGERARQGKSTQTLKAVGTQLHCIADGVLESIAVVHKRMRSFAKMFVHSFIRPKCDCKLSLSLWIIKFLRVAVLVK